MFRYLALVWDRTVATQVEAAQFLARQVKGSGVNWRSAFDSDGMKVFYTSSRKDSKEIFPLSGGQGVILGDIFERDDAEGALPRTPQFDPQLSRALIDSSGRDLIPNYWGNYVAFLCGPSQRWVVRAPAGHLPCLRVSFKGIHIYCSLLHDVDALNVLHFSVDWNYVAIRLASRGTLGDSGLHGVSAVRHGECEQVEGSQITKSIYWDPYLIASQRRIEDPAEAAAELRRVTKQCVHALASRHDSILLHLSGGLDSSIVLGCLADAPTRPTITCANFYSIGPGEDERMYARAAAEHANCRLVEWPRSAEIRYEGALDAPLVESSRPYHRSLEDDGATDQIAIDCGATTLLSGTGGDQIFFTGRPQLVMIDYVYNRGIDLGLFKAAWTAGYLEQKLVWEVLGQALYRGLVPRWRDEVEIDLPNQNLLTKKAIDLARGWVAAGRASTSYVPEGKQRHIHAISRSSAAYNPIQPLRDLTHVAPLIAQPLVELSVCIPTYVLTAGGQNRALARRAFASDIPEAVATRRVKGKISKYISNLVWNNRGFMRELLCDGILVQEGLMDRDRLARSLADHPSNIVKSHREITSAWCLEVWLRRVCAVQQRVAALTARATSTTL